MEQTLDQQLSAKFKQKLHDLKRKWNIERGKRNIELASRGSLRSGIALRSNREAISENMREMIEELIDLAKRHQELRQLPYTTEELKAIEELISSFLEGYLSLTQRGFEAPMASKGNYNSNALKSISNQLSQTQTECKTLTKTLLGDLKFYNPPVSPELVVNVINNINIDMDSLLNEIIQKVAVSEVANETEKTKFKKMLQSLRKSSMIKEIGKTVIQESIKLAAKSAIGVKKQIKGLSYWYFQVFCVK